MTSLNGVQIGIRQQPKTFFCEAIGILITCQRGGFLFFRIDHARIQLTWQVALGLGNFALMIEIQIQLLLQVGECCCWVSAVFKQRLSAANLVDLRCVAESLNPGFEQFIDLGQLFGMLIMQTMEEIVIARSGNELF